MAEEFSFSIRGPSDEGGKGGAPSATEGREPDVEEGGFSFSARPPAPEDYSFNPSIERGKSLTTGAISAGAGALTGAGVGAYRGKGLNAAQDKTRSVLTKIDELVSSGKVDQARRLAEINFGGKQATFTPPPPELSAGEKWAGKITRHVVPGAEGVVEQSQAWQRAKGQSPVMKKFYKMFPPAAPGEPSSTVERMILRSQQAEEAAKAAALTQAEDLEKIRSLASKAQVSSGIESGQGALAKIASISKSFPKTFGAVSGGLGGAGAALGGIEAMESYQKNDIPMFVMNALQAVGSLAGFYPPAALAGLGLAGAGTIGGHLVQRTREGSNLPEPTPEEIAEVEAMGPAMSRREFRPRP